MHVTHKVIKRSQVVTYQWTSKKMSLFIQVPLKCRFIQHKIWYMVSSRYGSPFLSAISSTNFEALAKRNRKSTQVCKTRTCERTRMSACRLASSRKSQNVVHFTRIQMNYDQLASTCVRVWARSKSTRVHARNQRTKEPQVERTSKTCIDCVGVRVLLARAEYAASYSDYFK